MYRLVCLLIILAATWLLLSGHYEILILAFGVVSCLLAAYIARSMAIVDEEGMPIELLWRALGYWPWLGWEILKANIEVSKRVLAFELDITPRIITVDATQPSQLGQVVYANSITLTPGTTALRVHEGKIDVHALTEQGAESLLQGEMDRRVTRIEKRRTQT